MEMQATAQAEVGSELAARFRRVRRATVEFVAPLTAEDQMVQSCPEASPTKWHLAHTSWFFETFVLREFLPGYEAYHPEFHWLFNSYYNALGEMPEKKLRASFSRPGLEEIRAYRGYVDAAVERLLGAEDVADEVLRRVSLGLEHEQQHLELIATDIKHALWTNPLKPVYLEASEREQGRAESSSTVRSGKESAVPDQGAIFTGFAGGVVEVGVTPAADDVERFAFDNETPRHAVFLQPYRLANRLVTCGEYLEFMNDNGYSRPELWLSEGWSAMRGAGWQAPLYWRRDPGTESGWSVYTLRGFVPLEGVEVAPVCHVSFFEADAFARWAAIREPGCRLPTEFEWEHGAASLGMRVRETEAGQELVTYPREERNGAVAGLAANMLESRMLAPTAAKTASGLQQMFGDVWEWTSSGYTGYPGYRPLPGALGEYNGKFMSSQVILRGGSCVTPATHIRATYRNFFPPGTRWQFSGLRLAKDGV